MNLTLPTEDGSEGTWDTELNDALERIDAHDHTSGNGVQIPSAGINIDADLSFGGYALTGLKAVAFSAVASADVSALTRALFVDSSDNELYWRTAGGANVKVTSGTALNISLDGGIEGDYTTTDAVVNYNDAAKLYKLLQDESPDFWAAAGVGDLRLYEKASGIANYVNLQSPASLAAVYDFIFPTALPASTSLLTLDASGQAATTRDATIDTLTTTGLTTADSLAVTNAAAVGSLSSAGVLGSAGLATFDVGVKVKDTGAGSTTLAHFEEGTWTPDVTYDGNTPSGGVSLTGRYQRIGDWVTANVFGEFTLGAAQGGTNLILRVTGLPYSCASFGVNRYNWVSTPIAEFTPSGGSNTCVGVMYNSTTSITIIETPDAGSLADISLANGTTYQLSFSISYKVA